MEQLSQWITNNPVVSAWITIISLLGVVITAVALCLQIKDKKRKTICYGINSNTLLDNNVSNIEGIEVLFHKEKVESVAVSKVKIWNGGNEIVEQTDFYPDNELKIVVPRHEKILAANITNMTTDTCKGEVSITKYNEVLVSFYCLEPKQSISLILYHTNTDECKTKVHAQIKGGKLVNKSIEVLTENGELVVTNGKYKLYFEGGPWRIHKNLIYMLTNMTGITVKKKSDY